MGVAEWIATDPQVRGLNPGLEVIFVRCFSVSPNHTESKKRKTMSVMLEVAYIVTSVIECCDL